MRTGILFWVRRLAAVLIFLLAAGVALAAGLLTPYFLAARTANILLLTISALAAFACSRVRARNLHSPAGELTEAKLTVMLSWIADHHLSRMAVFAVLRPSGSQFAKVVPYANTMYWQLPTGSVIAYSEYDPPPGVAVKPEAIVYLHGGPGVRQAPFDQDIYGSFAASGFRVFLYDQGEAVCPAFYHICGITRSPVPSPIWKR